MTLSEKYRPMAFRDVIGQEKTVKTIKRLSEKCWGGRAYYLTGKSGQGKTTLARIIASQEADKLYVTEVVARQLTTLRLREITSQWIMCPMLGNGYAVIINESHGLQKPVVEVLLDVLENLPDNVVVIFTTTNEGQELFSDAQVDAGPFASRCICLKLSDQGLTQQFAERALKIAQMEGLDGQPLSAYICNTGQETQS